LAGLTAEERRMLDRLIHVLAAEGEWPVPAVLQTERVEVVDGAGRVRLVVGDLAPRRSDDCLPGVALRDREGAERASLLLRNEGPELAFAMAGEDALVLGVDDEGGDATRPGPYLQLLDAEGDVVDGWRVDRLSRR
jgi:hypothetical protein